MNAAYIRHGYFLRYRVAENGGQTTGGSIAQSLHLQFGVDGSSPDTRCQHWHAGLLSSIISKGDDGGLSLHTYM